MWSWKRLDTFDLGVGLVLIFGFLARLMLARYGIYQGDFASWIAWGDYLRQYDFSSYYGAIWSDRLPGGILYLLWFISEIQHALALPTELIYKLPSNLADTALAAFIYMLGRQRGKRVTGMVVGFLYVLNPFTWHVSALWGQMDAVQALIVVAIIWVAWRRWVILAAILFAYIFVFKPHSILLAPILIIMMWRQRLNLADFWRQTGKALIAGVVALWLQALPFVARSDLAIGTLSWLTAPFSLLWRQFQYAVDLYPYATLQAFNFWMFLNKNWKPDDEVFLNISLHGWGIGLFLLCVLVVAVMLIASRRKLDELTYYLAAGVMFLGGFVFLTRAHDKHVYPFIALMAVTLLARERRLWKIILYAVASGIAVTSTLHSYAARYGGLMALEPVVAAWIGLLMVFIFLLALFELVRSLFPSWRYHFKFPSKDK